MDSQRLINIHDPAEVAHWTKVLDASHEDLVAAVTRVGRDAAVVSAYLRRGSDAEPPPAEQRPDGG
jgi:hypothetical protein